MGVVLEIQKECPCPVHDSCPLRVICGGHAVGAEGHGGNDLNPSGQKRKELLPRSISKVEKGKLLWTNLHFEQCVHVIQSGVFISFGYNEQGREVPFALFGAGIMVGIAELYLPLMISDTYHVRSMIPGTVCTVPLRAIRERLRYTTGTYEQRLLISALANQASSSFTQSKILSRSTIYERVLALLLYLQDLIARGKTERIELSLTHEEVATLVLSDRVSVTRALHKMRDEGLIELGYKTITLSEEALGGCDDVRISPTEYLIVNQEEAPMGAPHPPGRAVQEDMLPPYSIA